MDLNAGYGLADGANVQQWECIGEGQANQHWKFVPGESSLFYPLLEKASYYYPAEYLPVTSSDPAEAKPLGVGPVAHGLHTFHLMVKFNAFPDPVDIYVALHAPAMSPEIWFITPKSGLRPASKGIVRWKSGTTGPINEELFGEIPMGLLPAVPYNLYVLVTPAGSLETYYFWATGFLGSTRSWMSAVPSQPH